MKHLLLFCLLACQSYAVFIPVGGALILRPIPQDAQELPFTQRTELQRCGQSARYPDDGSSHCAS